MDPLIDSITSACWGNRHWNCSGTIRYFFRPWKVKQPCACPCHWGVSTNGADV